MMVVLFHAYPYVANQESWLMPIAYFFMQVGYAGVDVFFVISGYVMWISTQRSTAVPVGRFAYNRLTRIYLGYWPYFLIFLFLVHTYLPDRLENIDLKGSFWLTQIGINKLLIQIAWTLTYELYFYAWFAVLLLLPRRWLLPAIMGLFGMVVLIQGYHILVNDIYSIEQFPYIPFYLTFMTSPFCLEFLTGCLIGSYFQHHRLKNLTIWIVAGLLIFLAGFYYQKTQLLPNGMMSQGYFLPQRVLFWGTTSAIMVVVLVELNLRGVSIWKSGVPIVGRCFLQYLLVAHTHFVFVQSTGCVSMVIDF